ncbi:MAG: DUF4266 domain-containing protein [Pseudomonadota bacterium]|nr:DUF4266 domain-containing protein [Pseudomonadota bacterium]
MRILIRCLLAVSTLLCIGACTHVEPWQRGTLARPDMASDPAPLQQQVRRHVYSSREAAGIAGGGSGGGCGCY